MVSAYVRQMDTLADSGRKECAQMLIITSRLLAVVSSTGSFSPLVLLKYI